MSHDREAEIRAEYLERLYHEEQERSGDLESKLAEMTRARDTAEAALAALVEAARATFGGPTGWGGPATEPLSKAFAEPALSAAAESYRMRVAASARAEALRHAHARLIAWSVYIRQGGSWLGNPTEVKNDSDMAVRAAHEVYAMIGQEPDELDAELATEVEKSGRMGPAWWKKRVADMRSKKRGDQ